MSLLTYNESSDLETNMDFESFFWAIPFLGIIFSMSFLPLLAPNFSEKHGGAIPFGWTTVYLTCVAWFFGFYELISATFVPLLNDYVSFIIQIATLYIIAGGIFVDFPNGKGPVFNTMFLFFGSLLAGWIGTTGAAMLLIRPFLRANARRKYKVHLMVFFIFLVSNIGGAATPLGDPPLFIGFLKGVDFFWFIQHLSSVLFGTIFALCGLFYIVDTILFKKETGRFAAGHDNVSFVIKGARNLFFLVMVLFTVILCQFESSFEIAGQTYNYSSILRNVILVSIAVLSLKTTSKNIREKNGFTFAPIREVAEFFVAIFITVAPILSILSKGESGSLAMIFNWIAPGGEFILSKCFWASGLLSSVLDNAPTFLIFFHLASGNAAELMTTKAAILTSFSISTVFMGALTYIGNAPNLMVRSISEHYGIKVPSFLGFMGWSIGILAPIFLVISWLL
ncbi:MAG: sodium:proton antiporter [Alphaproteobacteria bacterium]|nr:sodium:proton antiporter [Alphaproteobacteria bacterium]